MAISWGSWEYSGGNGMRVGLDVSWESISHGESGATATVKIYTENQYTYNDGQTLNYANSLSGSHSFQNNQGGAATLRDTKTYTYSYGNCEYGSSPGSRTFKATISGAYNGVTPSKSVTSNIPARPYDSPADPTNVSTSRTSDTSLKTTWTNKGTCGKPWDSIRVQRDTGDTGSGWSTVGTPGGGSTSYTDSTTVANQVYRYRVRAENSIGNSSNISGDLIYTTPAAPTNELRSGTGATQTITWTNQANGNMDFRTEVWKSTNSGAWTLVGTTTSAATQTMNDTINTADRVKYKVRHKTNGGAQGTLYSAYSADTSETSGVTTPPNAPTNLLPSNNTIISPTQSRVFTWQHNPTDSTAQTTYQIQWRVVGAPSWTSVTAVSSATSSHTFAANTFPDNSTIEWQVRTRGANASYGPYSSSAVFQTVGDPNALREQKRVMRMNLETGRPETATVGVLPPIGSLTMFAGSTAPSGWLLCQGQSLQRADYPDLFGVIGTAYGSVDANSFTLPDLRDRFPVGVSGTKARGATGGSSTKTLSVGNLPPHEHGINHNHGRTSSDGSHSHEQDSQGGSSGNLGGATVIRRAVTAQFSGTGMMSNAGNHDHNVPNFSGTSQNGSSQGLNSDPLDVMNPWVAINYIIKV